VFNASNFRLLYPGRSEHYSYPTPSDEADFIIAEVAADCGLAILGVAVIRESPLYS
jgi:hypothetical protein